MYGVRECSNFINLHVVVQLSQHHLLKRFLSIVFSCLLCQGLIDCRCMGLFLGSLFCSIDLCVRFCANTMMFWLCSFVVLSAVWEGYISSFVLFLKNFLFYIGVYPINNVVTVSGAQQSDSAIRIHVSILPQTPLPSRLPHNIEKSSLCYAVGPCWLSILNIAVCTCQSQTP